MQLGICVLLCMGYVAMVGAFAVPSLGLTTLKHRVQSVQGYRVYANGFALPHVAGSTDIASIVDAVISNSMLARLSPAASLVSGGPLTDSNVKYDHKEWNKLLESCLQHKLGGRAVKLARKMQEIGIPLLSGVGLKLLNYLSDTGDYDACSDVLQWMKRTGTAVTGYHYLALLRCSGHYERAQSVLLQMVRANQKIHVVTYSAAIKACERSGDIRGALRLMEQMRAAGIMPNEVTYCCAISVAAKAGRPDLAVNLLREFAAVTRLGSTEPTLSSVHTSEPGKGIYTVSSGAAVNQYCYGSTISACARAGWWDTVDTLLEEIVTSGAEIEDTVFRAALVALRQRGSALHKACEGGETDTIALLGALLSKWAQHIARSSDHVYATAMEIYQHHNRSDLVMETYQERVDRLPGSPLSKAVLRCVMRACVESGNAQLAVAVVQRAQRDGVLTSAVLQTAVMVLEQTQQYEAAVKLMAQVLLPEVADDAVSGCEGNSTSDAAAHQVQLPRHVVMRVLQSALREAMARLAIPECVDALAVGTSGVPSEELHEGMAQAVPQLTKAAATLNDPNQIAYTRQLAMVHVACRRSGPWRGIG